MPCQRVCTCPYMLGTCTCTCLYGRRVLSIHHIGFMSLRETQWGPDPTRQVCTRCRRYSCMHDVANRSVIIPMALPLTFVSSPMLSNFTNSTQMQLLLLTVKTDYIAPFRHTLQARPAHKLCKVLLFSISMGIFSR